MSDRLVRVAHLFSSRLGREFSGDLKSWVRRLKAWSHPGVVHLILTPRDIAPVPLHDSAPVAPQPNWPASRLRKALLVGNRVLADRSKFDILHIHVPTWAGLLAAPVCRLAGRPSLFELTLMGSDNPSAIRAERFGRLKLAWYSQNRAFLCISRAASDDCIQMGFDERAVHLLPSPVDTGTFCPADASRSELRTSYGYPPDSFLILCVASVIHRKGIDVLVEVMKRARATIRDPFLVVVGPDSSSASPAVDDAFVKTVKAEIRSSGLGRAVRFTGQMDSDQVLIDHYRMADVMILPSRAEGSPHVILESMAAGLPVLASLLPGSTDNAIDQGNNGFLVPPEDIEGFVARLLWIEKHPGEVRAMGERARSKIVRSVGLKAWQGKLVDLYQSLLR
jgi:glycosyltransferase involved in cell wall biosynthesis